MCGAVNSGSSGNHLLAQALAAHITPGCTSTLDGIVMPARISEIFVRDAICLISVMLSRLYHIGLTASWLQSPLLELFCNFHSPRFESCPQNLATFCTVKPRANRICSSGLAEGLTIFPLEMWDSTCSNNCTKLRLLHD